MRLCLGECVMGGCPLDDYTNPVGLYAMGAPPMGAAPM